MIKKYSVMVLLRSKNSVLLQDINFGTGKDCFWDGFGSFYNESENPVDTAVKITKDNFKITLSKGDLMEAAKINFIIQKPLETVDLKTVIYTIDIDFETKQKVVDQESYMWHEVKNIPYNIMHPTSGKWMPVVLNSNKTLDIEFLVDQSDPENDKKMKILKFEYK